MKEDSILLVEDSRAVATQVTTVLQPFFNVTVCHSIEDFHKCMNEEHSLVLMDYHLDDRTCFDLIRITPAPVIILTGADDCDTELACLKEGAVDYVRKPFHPEILLHKVNMHMNIVKTKKMLECLSFEDNLTGLLNRRAFERDYLMIYTLRGRESSKQTAALLILDIDKFKSINDTYGHDIGDIVLITMANHMNSVCKRVTDGVYRWGGEEFVVLVPICSQEQAYNLAELLRRSIERMIVDTPIGKLNITVSIGVAGFSCKNDSLPALMKAADSALYSAKNSGRNNVKCDFSFIN